MNIKTLGNFDVLPDSLRARAWSFDLDDLRERSGSAYAIDLLNAIRHCLVQTALKAKAPSANDFLVFCGDDAECNTYTVAISLPAGSGVLGRFGKVFNTFDCTSVEDIRLPDPELPLMAIYRCSGSCLVSYQDEDWPESERSGVSLEFREVLDDETYQSMQEMMPGLED